MNIHAAWLQIQAGMVKAQNWFSRTHGRHVNCIENAKVVGCEIGKNGLVLKVSNGGTKPQTVSWLMEQHEAETLHEHYHRVAAQVKVAA